MQTADALKKAVYLRPDGIIRRFYDVRDGGNDTSGGYYVGFWRETNRYMIDSNNGNSHTWKFDWDGDGYFEQTVTMEIDTTNVTLEKPVLSTSDRSKGCAEHRHAMYYYNEAAKAYK